MVGTFDLHPLESHAADDNFDPPTVSVQRAVLLDPDSSDSNREFLFFLPFSSDHDKRNHFAQVIRRRSRNHLKW
jgi:hypothetical protein